jgi:uracil-DNA glycosylase
MLVKSLAALVTDANWRKALTEKVPETVFTSLESYLNERHQQGEIIFPDVPYWFRAINELPLQKVKVVIMGQDPYHGVGQAQGLSFSVPESAKIPPSLRNIFKEIESDCGIKNESGDLTRWLEQGVLLLNATLTVEQGKAGAHQKQGWEVITDAIITIVNEQQDNCVFLLWGGYAEKKATLLDSNKHLILTAPHPSPLSAHRGWFNCRHFSKVNEHLNKLSQQSINWHTGSTVQDSLF